MIRLVECIRAENDKDIYLVFDSMDTDLHVLIKKGTVLKDIHKRYVAYQLFKACLYLHSANVIHRDLKPSNILLNADCSAKVFLLNFIVLFVAILYLCWFFCIQ